ncbi:hypothetical protein COV16_02205 [Candidatus Woesearchaeota archaeon CG10_big_fil_rev_8_21_14_0_10_34_8]|nr:MAG: hypothetical protein COV16_02205 [Candidatus Woesearchaeota archaeon CG10_big_fil_rev_8_21_14_0_10_34_8]
MAKISGWIFISIGFLVIAVSIFFYDTLKFFIVLGVLMSLYGLGKISFSRIKDFITPPDIEGKAVNLDKVENPYLKNNAPRQRQIGHRPQQHKIPHKNTGQHHITHKGNYCSNCGAHLSANHRFCSHCGARAY